MILVAIIFSKEPLNLRNGPMFQESVAEVDNRGRVIVNNECC